MKPVVTSGVALVVMSVVLAGCDQGLPPQRPPKGAFGGGAMAGPRPEKGPIDFKSDADLAKKLAPRILMKAMADPMLSNPANKVEITAKAKVVHLTGHVKNTELKKRVGMIAQQVSKEQGAPGDLKLSNDLTIQ